MGRVDLSLRPSRYRWRVRLASAWGVGLLLSLCCSVPPALADPGALAEAVAALGHPLATRREAAVDTIAAAGTPGRAVCERLLAARDSADRLSGWEIVAQQPQWVSLTQARGGLGGIGCTYASSGALAEDLECY